MNLNQRFSLERERYVKLLEQTLRATPSAVGELLISIDHPELRYPYRYLRIDYFNKLADGRDDIREIRVGLDATPSPHKKAARRQPPASSRAAPNFAFRFSPCQRRNFCTKATARARLKTFRLARPAVVHTLCSNQGALARISFDEDRVS